MSVSDDLASAICNVCSTSSSICVFTDWIARLTMGVSLGLCLSSWNFFSIMVNRLIFFQLPLLIFNFFVNYGVGGSVFIFREILWNSSLNPSVSSSLNFTIYSFISKQYFLGLQLLLWYWCHNIVLWIQHLNCLNISFIVFSNNIIFCLLPLFLFPLSVYSLCFFLFLYSPP